MQQSSEFPSSFSQSGERARLNLHESSDDSVLHLPLYSPISNKSIRLLEIQGTELTPPEPGTTFRDLAICCRLRTVPLRQIESGMVSYTALSYVWGSTELKRYIICNGHLKPVTLNLYDVLWELARGHHEVPRLLWIDAICIDQDDNEDRTTQVQLMSSIYLKAKLVLVWLGNPSINSDKKLERFLTALGSNSPVNLKDTEYYQDGMRSHAIQAKWFSRIWTFQEICLAKTAAILHNRVLIPWDQFVSAMPSELYSIEAIQTTRRAIDTGQNLTVDALLSVTASRQAEDSRDRLYGVLGLCRGANSITADYSKSDFEVRVMLFLHLVQECFIPENKACFPVYVGEGPLFNPKGEASCDGSWVPSWEWLREGRIIKKYTPDADAHLVWQHLHKTFVPIITKQAVPSTNIHVQGLLCAIGDLYTARRLRFPPCVYEAVQFRTISDTLLGPSLRFFGDNDMAPKWFDASQICEMNFAHSSRSHECAPLSAQHCDHDTPNKNNPKAKYGWVCQIFGSTEPMILRPCFDAQRRKVLFTVSRTANYWEDRPPFPAPEKDAPHFTHYKSIGDPLIRSYYKARGREMLREPNLFAPMTFELIGDPSGLVFQDLDALYEAVSLDRQR